MSDERNNVVPFPASPDGDQQAPIADDAACGLLYVWQGETPIVCGKAFAHDDTGGMELLLIPGMTFNPAQPIRVSYRQGLQPVSSSWTAESIDDLNEAMARTPPYATSAN